MTEQQSQKEGLKSSAQKETRARDAKAPLPASNPVGGAFGGAESKTQTAQDLSGTLAQRSTRKRNQSGKGIREQSNSKGDS
jgi:hypothetical protein